jgi:putative transposase
MTYTFIAPACADLPVAACCRAMRVSTLGFYSWQAESVRQRDLDDAYLSNTVVDIWNHEPSLPWPPRVHAELKLGQDVRYSRKRVERLMRQANIAGIHRRHPDEFRQRAIELARTGDLARGMAVQMWNFGGASATRRPCADKGFFRLEVTSANYRISRSSL